MPFGGRSVGAVARGLIGLGVIALIFFFLIRSLAFNWHDLRSEEIDIQPALLLLSLLPPLAALLVLSLIWTRIVTFPWRGKCLPNYAETMKQSGEKPMRPHAPP